MSPHSILDAILQGFYIDRVYRHEPWLLYALALLFLPFPMSPAKGWRWVSIVAYAILIVAPLAMLEMHRHSFWAWSVLLGAACYRSLRPGWSLWVALSRSWSPSKRPGRTVLIGFALLIVCLLLGLWLGHWIPSALLQVFLYVLELFGVICLVVLAFLLALSWLRPGWRCVRMYLRSDPRMIAYLDCVRRLFVSDPDAAQSLFPGGRLTGQDGLRDDAGLIRLIQPGWGFWSLLFGCCNGLNRRPWLWSLVWLAAVSFVVLTSGEGVWVFLRLQPLILLCIYVSLGCLLLALSFPAFLLLRGFFSQPDLRAAVAFFQRRLGLPALDSRFVLDCLRFERDRTWNEYEELRYPTPRGENGLPLPAPATCCDLETAVPQAPDKSRKLRRLRLRWLALTEALAECYCFSGPAGVTPDGVSADPLEASQVLSEAGELQHEVARDLEQAQRGSANGTEDRALREFRLARHFFDLAARCLESCLDPQAARGRAFCEPLTQDTWWKSAAAPARQPASGAAPTDTSEHHLRLALFRLYQLLEQLDVRCGGPPSSAAAWLASLDRDVERFLTKYALPAKTKPLLVHFAAYASKTLNERAAIAHGASPVLNRVLGSGQSYEVRLAELLEAREREELDKYEAERRAAEDPQEEEQLVWWKRLWLWTTRAIKRFLALLLQPLTRIVRPLQRIWARLTRLDPEEQRQAIRRDCQSRSERFWRLAGRLREQQLGGLQAGGVVASPTRIQAARFYSKAHSRRVWRLCST